MTETRKLHVLAAIACVAAWSPVRALACDAPADEPCPAYSLEAGAVADAWRNAHGGLQPGNALLSKYDLLGTIDGASAWGVPGLTLHGHLQASNGHEFSGRYLGDAQVASNIEGVGTTRILELWAQFDFTTAGKHNLKAGLFDFNSEFDSIEPATLFLNSSHGIGPDISQTGENGPSIFPVTSLALRLRGEQRALSWQFAVLDAVPGRRNDYTRTGFDLSTREGVLMAGEFDLDTTRFGRLALGMWRYSAAFDRLNAVDGAGDPLHQRGNQGAYASVTRLMMERGSKQATAWLRVGVADSRFNAFGAYTGAGVALRGLLAGRPDDQLGIALAVVHSGPEWRAAQLASGATPARRETNLEITWRAPLADWLTLQPDLQYVWNPGLDGSLDSGFALGMRFEIAGSWTR